MKTTALLESEAGVEVGQLSTGGGIAISTQSVLRATAHSGGCQMLGSCPPVLLPHPIPCHCLATPANGPMSMGSPPSPLLLPQPPSVIPPPCCEGRETAGWVVSYCSPILCLLVVPMHPIAAVVVSLGQWWFLVGTRPVILHPHHVW